MRMFLIVTLIALGPPLAMAEDLQVGFARIDITPPSGYRKGGGYHEVISTGVHDPLYAKALVLQQGKFRFGLIVNDLLSVPAELSDAARSEISIKFAIPRENLVIAATHNHGAPEYWGPLRDLFHEAAIRETGNDSHESIDYQKSLVKHWSEALRMAVDRLTPASMEVVVADQRDLAFNRRFHMSDGTVRFNPGFGNPDIRRPAGPIDTELPVLLFRDQSANQHPIGSLSVFAIHTAVFGGTEFGSDFPGVIQSRLENAYGSNFVSVFAEGTAGDINHINVNKPPLGDSWQETQRVGNTLADTILKSVTQVRSLSDLRLAVSREVVSVPFEPVTEGRYIEACDRLLHQSTRSKPFLELVECWRDLHRWHHQHRYGMTKPCEVQVLRLDRENAIVFLPHEVFVELGLTIKASSPFRTTIVVSLANDVDYYIPTRRAFEEGSYEVSTCPLSPGCGELLTAAALRRLNELYSPSGKQ